MAMPVSFAAETPDEGEKAVRLLMRWPDGPRGGQRPNRDTEACGNYPDTRLRLLPMAVKGEERTGRESAGGGGGVGIPAVFTVPER